VINYNTVWVATVPRTGSMWATNIVREIFSVTDHNVFPEQQLKNDKDWQAAYQEGALKDPNPNNRYVLKVHTPLNQNLPKSKIITTIRNPYDTCASFFHFMKCDLDRAINVALSLPTALAHYKKVKPENLFVLRYEHIEESPEKLISDLSIFLNTTISEEQALAISKKFTKEQVKQIISDTDQALQEKISNKQEIKAAEVVILDEENYRSFDANTGFQTGHVSDRESGEWRLAFTEAEQERLVDALDASTIELGYVSEKT